MPSRERGRRRILGLAVLVLAAAAVVLLVARDAGHDRGAAPVAHDETVDAPAELVGRKGARPAEAASAPTAPAGETPAGAETGNATPDLVMRLAGVVVDPEGRPLGGIPVRVLVARDSGLPPPPGGGPVAETTSDAAGRFALRFEPWGPPAEDDAWLRVHVEAVHPRFLVAVASYPLSLREQNADTRTHEDVMLRFRAPFRVRCEVSDESGAPVLGATCRWVGCWYSVPTPEGAPYQAVTDARGVAELLLPVLDEPASISLHTTGVHSVLVQAAGYAPVLSPSLRIYVPDPEHPVTVPVTLPRAEILAGTLEDDRGQPVANTTFDLTGEREGDEARMGWCRYLDSAPRTDEAGAFAVAAAPGRWKLELQVAGYVEADVTMEAGGPRVLVRVVRQPRRTLRFHRPDGTRVLVMGYELASDAWSMRSRGPGREEVVLDDLPPGSYHLAAHLCGRAIPLERDIELRPGENEPLDLVVDDVPGRRLTGTLADAEGRPIAGWLTLSPRREEGAEDDDEDVESLDYPVGADGRFAFEGLAPGAYTIAAEANGQADRAFDVEVGAQDPEPLELRMGPGATLRVRLPPRPEGATWTWQVQVVTATGSVVESLYHELDERGFLEFPALPAGRTLVLLESPSFRATPVPRDPYVAELDLVDGKTTEHVFPPPPLVRVVGRVVDGKGEPLAQAAVDLLRVGPDEVLSSETPYCSYGWKDLMTDDDGRFTAEGLLPGRYAVTNVRRDEVPESFVVDAREVQEVLLRAK